jgi:[methyl-Co(III) methanol-specific corrinoid protein]:coenzyme M methyltransferase
MNDFSYKRRVLKALVGGPVDRIPVTSLAGCGGTVTVEIQQATDTYFPEAHKDPVKMATLAIASHKMTGIENIRVPFDIVVEPEALGCQILWSNDPKRTPAVTKPVFETPEDLKKPKKWLTLGRIPIILDAIRLIREEVGDFLPISSLVLGPFTLVGELFGIENTLRWTVKHPDYIQKAVAFTTELLIAYANAQYRAGSDIVQVCDPTASSNLISPKAFRQYAKPALTTMANNLGGLRILHICGRTEPIIKDMAEIGFDGISIEESVDIAKQKPFLGNVKILGNVSSNKTLIFGSTDDVKQEVITALNAGVDLLEPSCGFSLITPLQNITTMVKAVTHIDRT